ncbi:hypothetical protein DFH29DRAFT_1072635 [Suillus ampliporus]|nr:hypothetical protein DFH29DRAFT_1072635 [Suillus ampliporus]
MARFVTTCTGVLSNVGSNLALTLDGGVATVAALGAQGAQTWMVTYNPTGVNVAGPFKSGANHLGWTQRNMLSMAEADDSYNWTFGTQANMVAAGGVNVTANINNVLYYLKVDNDNKRKLEVAGPNLRPEAPQDATIREGCMEITGPHVHAPAGYTAETTKGTRMDHTRLIYYMPVRLPVDLYLRQLLGCALAISPPMALHTVMGLECIVIIIQDRAHAQPTNL